MGWIFTQSVQEREYIISTEEICQMAAMQDELGERAVTAVVSMVPSEEGRKGGFVVGGGLCCRRWV